MEGINRPMSTAMLVGCIPCLAGNLVIASFLILLGLGYF